MRSFPVNSPVFTYLAETLRFYSPKLLTLFILLFSLAPTYLPGYSAVRPNFMLIPVFYWAVYKPENFSVIAAFTFGLMQDLLEETPLGVNTLVFTVFYILAESQRRFLSNKPFTSVWVGFAVLSFIILFLNWLIIAINYGRFSPFGTAFVGYLILLAAYPVVVWPCARLYLYLLDKNDGDV